MDEIENAINQYRANYNYEEIDVYTNPKFFKHLDEEYINNMVLKKNNIIINKYLPDDVKLIIRKHYELAKEFGNEIKINAIKEIDRPNYLLYGKALYKKT